LHLVIGPRISYLRTGKPLTTVATSEQRPTEITQGIRMKYLYEAMHQERIVPLECYGIYVGRKGHGYLTVKSSSPLVDDDEVERVRNHGIQLMAENSKLRAQIADLQRDKEILAQANEKLAQKFAKLGHLQPAGYIRSFFHDVQPINVPDAESDDDQLTTWQVPFHHTGPRSVSTGDIEALASALDQELNITGHQRQHSELLAQKYADVFSSLQSSSLPALRLSVLSSLITPSPSSNDGSAARPITLGYVLKSGRRSGMIFDRSSMGYLAGVGGRTPTAEDRDEESSEEDNTRTGGYAPVTPKSEEKKRFDLLQ
jgi:hypothetical protein